MRLHRPLITLLGIVVLSTIGTAPLTAWQSAETIHAAAAAGRLDDVQALLAADRDRLESRDERGRTPLYRAAAGGHVDIIAWLLDAGAGIEAADASGATPLIGAVLGNHLPAVKLLIERGADSETGHASYGRAVDIAFWVECRLGWSGITGFLVAQGAAYDPSDGGMATRLNLAATFQNLEMARFALAQGADVNGVSTADGQSELEFAVGCGSAPIVRLYLEHGADVHGGRDGGWTLLLPAVEKGSEEIVRLLLEAGASPGYSDAVTGRTLLHTAAIRGYDGIATLLLEAGLETDAADGRGRVPLYHALRYSHPIVARTLRDHGAAPLPADVAEEARGPLSPAPPETGEALAWWLDQSGWAIRTADHLLVINSFEDQVAKPARPSLANGFIRADEVGGQNLFVFYTTWHWPDMTGYLHRIEDSLSQVTYIHNEHEAWRGCRNTVYLVPGEYRRIGDLDVQSVPCTYSFMTVGYVLQIDGLSLYFANFSTDRPEEYREDLLAVRERFGPVDLAFLPAHPADRLAESDLQMVLEILEPRALGLLENARRTELFDETVRQIRAWGFDREVFAPDNPGDLFRYSARGRDSGR